MKILVSDVEQPHANACKAIILEECPTATVAVILGSLTKSIVYALANNYSIISRSTTGLSDSRNENEGDTAWAGVEIGGAFSDEFSDEFDIDTIHRVGIVHAHGSNSHILLTDPSCLDIIVAVGAGDGAGNNDASYGPGLELFNDDETTESYATARIAGIIAQLMTSHPLWTFQDARMALRQTASLYGIGWISDGGFGASDKVAANLVETIKMFSPHRVEIIHDEVAKTITFIWKNSPQTDGTATIIAKYGGIEPVRTSVPTQDNAHIIYNGSLETLLYNYSTAIKNVFWFVVHTEGSYSLIESFDSEEIDLGSMTEFVRLTSNICQTKILESNIDLEDV